MPEYAETDFAIADSLRLQNEQRFRLGELNVKTRAISFAIYDIVKRILDLIFAVGLLMLLWPIMVVIALIIKIDSSGPVLFQQTRVGRDGEKFEILKFRTMIKENNVSDYTCDDKYTRTGKFLRRISLDELPQLFNVLVGQMSFVGPRPWIPEYWNNMNDEERMRSKVRPGITGLAAAKGRNGLSVFQKIAYDLEYVRNYSFRQDVKVVFLTIRMVMKKEAAEAGKGGIHNDIEDLKLKSSKNRKYFAQDDL